MVCANLANIIVCIGMTVNVDNTKKLLKSFPDEPGVYFFKNDSGQILYVGKATSLRDRVRSYFGSDIAETRGPLIVKLLQEFSTIEYLTTDSVLEALLLEANLIKTHQPPHNSRDKDNKSYNYVVFTNEEFPRVLTIRGRTMFSSLKPSDVLEQFGPFPHGMQLREAMKIIRRIFPYADKKCVSAPDMIAKGKSPKACFNRQIGLCPGICTGEMSATEYKARIAYLSLFFQGKKKEVIKNLERDMDAAAAVHEFEKADKIKKTIFALEHIQDIALLKHTTSLSESVGGDIRSGATMRIEGYDIAHLQGTSVVGVMTVVEDSEMAKSEYRKFKIKLKPGIDDTGALKEILRRRLKHVEWPLPQLIVVDGSIAQRNAATAVLKEYGFEIPVVSVVKDEHHKPKAVQGDTTHAAQFEREILMVNSESHRFAITYHRQLRRKRLF